MAPQALFIADRAEPDPARPGYARLDATRWRAGSASSCGTRRPTTSCCAPPRQGELDSESGLAKSVDRMLASPRLETGMRAFFDDMLRFDDLGVLAKDPAIYPIFGAETIADAREQTLRTLVDHLLVKKRDYRDLFTTPRHVHVAALAVIYDVAAPPGWTPYTSPAGQPARGPADPGQLPGRACAPGTQFADAARQGAARAAAVPDGAAPAAERRLLAARGSRTRACKTARERLDVHRTNPVCAGCHKITDPIGLALENFDGAGQFRATERGASIDTSGALDGKQLRRRRRPRRRRCTIIRQLSACLVQACLQLGYRRPAPSPPTSRCWTGSVKRFAADGYRLPDLLRTMALSSAFATV